MTRRRQALALCLAAGLPSTVLAADPRVMKISSPVSGDASNEWMQRFKQAVEKRLGDRLRVELYPSNQLGQIPATVEGVALATIEMTIPAAGFLTGLEPRFHVLDAPGLFDSVEHAQRVFSDGQARKLLSQFGEHKGIEPLFVYAASPLMLLTRRPLKSLSDLKGMKIRAAGGAALQIEPLRRLGATALSMPLGETLAALQNRALDGMVSGIAVFTGLKYYDVARYLTVLPRSFLVVVGLVSRRFLSSVGTEAETAIREESAKAEMSLIRFGAADVRKLEAQWTERGGRVQALDAPEGERYLSVVDEVLQPMLRSNETLRTDHAALLQAAARTRR
jgi:TRAP-type C4-dicarboxylate transport system substrate-binding protein